MLPHCFFGSSGALPGEDLGKSGIAVQVPAAALPATTRKSWTSVTARSSVSDSCALVSLPPRERSCRVSRRATTPGTISETSSWVMGVPTWYGRRAARARLEVSDVRGCRPSRRAQDDSIPIAANVSVSNVPVRQVPSTSTQPPMSHRPIAARRVQALLAATFLIGSASCTQRATQAGSGASGPPKVGPQSGTVMVVGGGALGPEIVARFIAAAGGPDALIVDVPTAGGDSVYPATWHGANFLKAGGAKNVVVLHTTAKLTLIHI